jgi:hypothetical protein
MPGVLKVEARFGHHASSYPNESAVRRLVIMDEVMFLLRRATVSHAPVAQPTPVRPDSPERPIQPLFLRYAQPAPLKTSP